MERKRVRVGAGLGSRPSLPLSLARSPSFSTHPAARAAYTFHAWGGVNRTRGRGAPFLSARI